MNKPKQKITFGNPRPIITQDTPQAQQIQPKQESIQAAQIQQFSNQGQFNNVPQVPSQQSFSQSNQQNFQQPINQVSFQQPNNPRFEAIQNQNEQVMQQQVYPNQQMVINQQNQFSYNNNIAQQYIQPPQTNMIVPNSNQTNTLNIGGQQFNFVQQKAQNVNQIQQQYQQPIINPVYSQNVEETRIYNQQNAQTKISELKNTDLEEYELSLSRKNKIEIQSNFKSNIDSLNSTNYDSQPCVLDMPKIIEKTKNFCQKNQGLAQKLKDSMENLIMYDINNQHQNKFEACYEKFSQQYQIPNQSMNISQVQQELSRFDQQELQVQLPFNSSNLQQEIQILSRLNLVYKLFSDVAKKQKETTQIPVDSLPLYSIFLYTFLIKKQLFHITVEYQDYYFFESITQQQNSIQNGNFVALLLYALKCEQRLHYLIYQQQNKCQDQYINFDAISQFFSTNSLQFQSAIKIKIQIGPAPDSNKRPIDKYKELLEHYEKGCKSQIFTMLVEGKWPENLFQKNFEESFNVLGKFQLWLIWMRQMQEKIIDFQLFIRARIKQGSMEQVEKEFSLNFTQKLKQFQQDIENSIFLKLANSFYCTALNVQSKERAILQTPIRSILYSVHDQSSIMIGHIICKKTLNSCCFYFKDKYDHYVKKVTAIIQSVTQQQAVQNYQLKCDSDFQISQITSIDKTFSFLLSDKNKLNEKYNDCGKFYDTLLINSLIEQTRKRVQETAQINLDLSELVS